MAIAMTNPGTKQYLVKKTGLAFLGDDYDYRKTVMSPGEAEQRFDEKWAAIIEPVVATADKCDVDLVREHVTGNAAGFINPHAEHRHFKLDGKFFIAQLTSDIECDQLWIVPSAIRDPWTIYVKFAEVPTRKRFEEVARQLGWEKPQELAEKLLVDFLESTTRQEFKRLHKPEKPEWPPSHNCESQPPARTRENI